MFDICLKRYHNNNNYTITHHCFSFCSHSLTHFDADIAIYRPVGSLSSSSSLALCYPMMCPMTTIPIHMMKSLLFFSLCVPGPGSSLMDRNTQFNSIP